MKVGLVTKLGKRKKTTSKKIRDDDMSKNCGIIVIFSIFCQSASRIPDAESGKSMFSIIVTLHLTKTENRT